MFEFLVRLLGIIKRPHLHMVEDFEVTNHNESYINDEQTEDLYDN